MLFPKNPKKSFQLTIDEWLDEKYFLPELEYGNANALISLIRHGAILNVIYKQNGYSLLMKALSPKVIPNRYLIVVLLLKNGADVNIISNNSKTALYMARKYHPRYINLLKRFGAEF